MSAGGTSAPLGFRDAELTGTGATSRVYRAHDVKAGREVALKRLHRQLVRSGDALARLRRELDALRMLNHPGVVPESETLGDLEREQSALTEASIAHDLSARVALEATEEITRAMTTRVSLTEAGASR